MLDMSSRSPFISAVITIFERVYQATLVPDETRGATITIEDGLKARPVAISDHNPLARTERQAWLDITAADLRQTFTQKYLAGQAGHGSDLGVVSVRGLLDEMEQEALDQLAYVRELKRRLM